MSTSDPKRVHGLYGDNRAAIPVLRRIETRPLHVWQRIKGKGRVQGFVLFNGTPVLGVTVRMGCLRAVTDTDGYRFDTTDGRYIVASGMIESVSDMYVSGETDVVIPVDGQARGDIILQFPSEDYREIIISGDADLIDRQVVGHDRIEHPRINLRPLQIGPRGGAVFEASRAVWPIPADDTIANVTKPQDGQEYRFGDWDYTAGFGFGADTLDIRVFAELPQLSQNARVTILARIVERDGASVDIEVVGEETVDVPRNGSASVTISLKSSETAPDRAEVRLAVQNARARA